MTWGRESSAQARCGRVMPRTRTHGASTKMKDEREREERMAQLQNRGKSDIKSEALGSSAGQVPSWLRAQDS